MELERFNDPATRAQAIEAGFSTVELYIQSLLERDANRLEIQAGLEALKADKHRSFKDFDREFRLKNGLAER